MRLENADLKGGFNTSMLYYHSIGWIGRDTFGHARLTREVTDAWMARRFAHGGQQFTLEAPELTPAELGLIPGASTENADELVLEVLEKSGAGGFTVKADEHKYWSMQTGEILQQYNDLKERNAELMIQLFGHPAANSTPSGTSTAEKIESEETPIAGFELESMAKLEEAHGIETKCNTEIASVQLVLAKDKSVWLVSSQDKALARHQVLGGFGTGQWVPEADSADGIDFKMEQGDQTLVQLEESSFNAEAQGFSTHSLYKLLVRSEREKGIVEHKVSFLGIQRKSDTALEVGCDGFDVVVKTAMKFKCMKDPRANASQEERITSKNFFGKVIDAKLNDSAMKIFRFRFERVGATWKVQRPCCVAKRAIMLKKDKPYKLTQD